jgi:hypothetical protein
MQNSTELNIAIAQERLAEFIKTLEKELSVEIVVNDSIHGATYLMDSPSVHFEQKGTLSDFNNRLDQ